MQEGWRVSFDEQVSLESSTNVRLDLNPDLELDNQFSECHGLPSTDELYAPNDMVQYHPETRHYHRIPGDEMRVSSVPQGCQCIPLVQVSIDTGEEASV